MRISDWSSDVCSSDLVPESRLGPCSRPCPEPRGGQVGLRHRHSVGVPGGADDPRSVHDESTDVLGGTVSTSDTEVIDDASGPDGAELNRVLGPKLLLLFIVGDILGAGIYAVTGTMAAGVGGIVWLPFLLAFAVASLTALSYLALVTKYPQAAGAALYTHTAFAPHLVPFIVAFAVICSGITSASTSAVTLSQNFFGGMAVNGIWGETVRSEEHTSELQSLMRISYAVF